jgi:predicted kinase
MGGRAAIAGGWRRATEAGMLYIFAGLPGAGKTALSRRLARDLPAVHLRIDTIEQALRDGGVRLTGPEGYLVAYRVAEDNLRAGLHVVADSVNPLRITRAAWRDAAERAGAHWVEIEVVCSDAAEHRARVETRHSDIAGFAVPTWDAVVGREYEPWDLDHLVIDTAGRPLEESVETLYRQLGLR